MKNFLEIRVTEDSATVKVNCTGIKAMTFLSEGISQLKKGLIEETLTGLKGEVNRELVEYSVNALVDEALERSKSTTGEEDKEDALDKLIEDIIRACL